MLRMTAVVVCLGLLLASGGCLGWAANIGRNQAARRSDHYLRKYVEPEVLEQYDGDPAARAEAERQAAEARAMLRETIRP